jgi:glycosyltransferase involved in cell wall biosynthesis
MRTNLIGIEESKLQLDTQPTKLRARVVHFTSSHDANDVRVFQKECQTLAEEGYQVTLVARHPRDEVVEGVRILGITPEAGRIGRVTKLVWQAYRTAARQNAEVYHFHDPELILAGLLLKLRGHKVIYDSHEAFARKLLSKRWIPRLLRTLVSRSYAKLERALCRTYDHVIAADRTTAAELPGSRVTVVANYPIITEAQHRVPARKAPRDRYILLYVGGLERDRGIGVMLDIAELLRERVELRLLGRWYDPENERRASRMSNVRFLGFEPLNVLYEEMMNADLGLVLLQPIPAYLYAAENTVKIFEYMSCALPVVASDFPAFRTMVAETQCGVCVDPTDARATSQQILHLLEQPKLREQMGRNGHNAVLTGYNWEAEKRKLLAVYEEVAGGAQCVLPRIA